MKIYNVELRGYEIQLDLTLINKLNTIALGGKWLDKSCTKHGMKELTIEFKSVISISQLIEIFDEYNFDITTKYQGEYL